VGCVREDTLVDFTVLRYRESLDCNDARGDEVRGKEGLEEGFERYFFGATSNNVANERFVFCRGALGDDASLRDGIVTAKRFFYFDRVNAEATNLTSLSLRPRNSIVPSGR